MKVEEVLELARAGFSKEDIIKLTAAGQTTSVEKDSKGSEEPAAKPAEQSAAPDYSAALASLQQEISSLTAQLQAGAIAQSEQPAKQSVDDILASIINPE